MLLDADDPTVRRRIDEFRLGRRDRAARAFGKDPAMGRLDEPARRRRSRHLGSSQPDSDDLKRSLLRRFDFAGSVTI